MRLPFLRPALVLAVLWLLPAATHAQILYSYTTTLDVVSGLDTALLDGAQVNIQFEVPTGATYVERFARPAVPVVNPLITISGSGVAANNGTFALEPTAFYPSFAGFFTEPGGTLQTFLLPGGGALRIHGLTVPTPTGFLVTVGQTATADHFGPTTSDPGTEFFSVDGTFYNLVGTVVTATEQVDTETRISTLITTVRGLGLPKGIENSFVVKLEAALEVLEAGDTAAACDSLQAFINHAEAQRGKKLPADDAEDLIEAAQIIRTELGCS